MYDITLADVRDVLPALPAKAPRKAKAKAPAKPKGPTIADLRAMCTAKGLKTSAKHTKPELAAMLATGVYVYPAAQGRENARRKAARALARSE